MESVKTRALKVVNGHPRTWTAQEMMREMCCSYSTARVALKQLCDAGQIQRSFTHRNNRAEWTYFRIVGSERPLGSGVS